MIIGRSNLARAGFLMILFGCDVNPGQSDPGSVETFQQKLTINQGFSIDRIIPLRFVQFTTGAGELTAAQLDEQVSGMNETFASAGIQFYIRSTQVVVSSTFATVEDGVSYSWPTPTSSAPPLAFRPNCQITLPSGGSEPETMALFRAGSWCSFGGEILIYTVADLIKGGVGGSSWGTYPWEANAVIMNRGNMGTGNRTIAHEVGHYLGLPHAFKGNVAQYDLGSSNSLNPQTGVTATLSDYWDLVYKPGHPHTFFNDKISAAAVESSLVQIQFETNDGNICLAVSPVSMPTCAGGTVTGCPFGTPDGALRMLVNTTITGCEEHYTGEPAMKGLGFTFTSGSALRGVNVMSYNYTPSATRFSVSASQIAQIKRVLTYDIGSSWFPFTSGRRDKLGLGGGTWTSWESLGGQVTDSPAIIAKNTKLEVVVRQTDGSMYHKSFQSGAWSPSQTGFTSLGGSTLSKATIGVRTTGELDVVVRGSDNVIYNKVRNTNGSWWPSQTDWTGLGGAVTSAPALAERSTGEIDVMTAQSDGNANIKIWNSSGWWPSQTGWASMGTSSNTPTIVEDSGPSINLLSTMSTGNGAFKIWTSSGGWIPAQSGWTDIGGPIAGVPAAASWGPGRLDVVTRLPDNTVATKTFTGTWSPSATGWTSLGGSTAGQPSIATWGSGRLDVVARSNDGTVVYKNWTQVDGWWPSQTDWAVLGGAASGDPVIATWGSNRLDIFVVGSDGALWHRARTN